MNKIDFDKLWIGLVIGILTPLIFYGIYYLMVVDTGVKKINIGICIAANLIPFYFYQRKEKNNGLKGVFISTMVLVGVVLILGFFSNYFRLG